MTRRGLFTAAVLLASFALPQSSTGQAAVSQPADADSSGQQLRVECTSVFHADTLIGKHGCVAGKVSHIRSNRHGDIRLSLCRNDRECPFRAVVERSSRDQVGDLNHLRGKMVAIVGDVTESHDAPRILISDKEQIKVAPGNLPQEFDATQQRPRGKVHHETIPTGRAW